MVPIATTKERNTTMNKKMLKGFTLVEIMIVVAIIAILAAVAIPNFVKYRKSSQATACVSNLKQIQAAKEQCAMAGKTLDASNLYGVNGYIKVEPTCPGQGTYTIGDADTDPTCSVGANSEDPSFSHALPTASGS